MPELYKQETFWHTPKSVIAGVTIRTDLQVYAKVRGVHQQACMHMCMHVYRCPCVYACGSHRLTNVGYLPK